MPDGSTERFLYVGPNNNIIGLALAVVRQEPMEHGALPPEIRRNRPDQGAHSWEVVLDYRAVEAAPYHTVGFRIMQAYRARSGERTYLYAGTAATHGAALWRTASGEQGDWQEVFSFDANSGVGSIRGMVAHRDGLLYFSTTPEGDINPGIGRIWATDGAEFEEVDTATMNSFGRCLYAGVYNPVSGFEVWKLRCAGDYDAPPQRVISGGGGREYNEVAMTPRRVAARTGAASCGLTRQINVSWLLGASARTLFHTTVQPSPAARLFGCPPRRVGVARRRRSLPRRRRDSLGASHPGWYRQSR